VDGDGNKLNGANAYTLTFPGDALPPADAFWSLSMYGDAMFFVDNPLDRYALGDRSDLKRNPDGSVTLYLQQEDPGKGKRRNWLPAPAGGFYVTLRMYLPRETALDGTWTPPPIVKTVP